VTQLQGPPALFSPAGVLQEQGMEHPRRRRCATSTPAPAAGPDAENRVEATFGQAAPWLRPVGIRRLGPSDAWASSARHQRGLCGGGGRGAGHRPGHGPGACQRASAASCGCAGAA
jgi:hypothetical protein